MINENKIREACASNRERGFKMLMDSFQVPIYNYIRRLVVSHVRGEKRCVSKFGRSENI